MCIHNVVRDFQGPNGHVTYAVVGDAVALEYFSVWADSGVVTLRQSIADVSERSFGVVVEASDQGVPPNRANVTVAVEVISDQSQPLFDERSLDAQLDSSVDVGSDVAMVSAAYPSQTPPEVRRHRTFEELEI